MKIIDTFFRAATKSEENIGKYGSKLSGGVTADERKRTFQQNEKLDEILKGFRTGIGNSPTSNSPSSKEIS